MPDCHVDTIHRIAPFEELALIDDGVDGYGTLACLPIADNEFALAPPDGYHGVYGLDAGLEGFVDWLAVDNSGGFALERHLV